jgi:hypothetical protein
MVCGLTLLLNRKKSERSFFTEKEHWEAAMQKEMDSIYSNDVWDLVELPANRNGCSRRKPTLMVQLRDLKLG